MKNKVLSIVIVNYNTCDLTLKCLYSILADKTIPPYEIILIDNASTDGSIDRFNRLNWKNLIILSNKENLGFSKAVNQGIKVAKGRYILLLNSDTEVPKGSIKKMLDFASKNPDAGVIAPKLVYGDGKIQPSAFHLPTVWGAIKEFWLGIGGSYGQYIPDSKVPIAVDAVVGACFLITPKALKKVGFFDERYFMYFEDLDYCRRVKKMGLKVYYLPNVRIVHLHGQSGKKLADERNQWKRLIPSSKIYHGVIKHFLINFIIKLSNLLGNFFSFACQISKNRLVWFFIISLLVLPTFRPLLQKGYFYMQDDLQAFRIQQLDKCVKDFQIPCRWVPDAGYQYGYPQFNFYPPFVYYLGEFFRLLGFQFIDSVKILFILGYLLSAFSMFILLEMFVGKWNALFGSIVYTYAPYKAVEVYVRGALSEFWSFVFFPLIFWSSYLLIKTGKRKYLILLSLFLSFLVTTHVLMTIAFLLPFGFWVLFWLLKEKRLGSFKNLFLSSILAIGLSAFFVLPVIFERKFVHMETLLMGYFDYRKHFLGLHKILFDREWGYGSSGFPNEKLNLSLGIVQFLSSLLLFFYVFWTSFSSKNFWRNNLRIFVIFAFFLLLFILFLIHPRSIFMWEKLNFLPWFQFPWRFMTVALFISSLLFGLSISFLPRKSNVFFGIAVSVLAIFLNVSYFRPRDWYYEMNDSVKFSGSLWEKQLTISIFDYLPIYATLPPWSKAPDFPEILDGDVNFISYQKGSNYQIGKVDVLTDKALLRAPIFDFPGMKVFVDGNEVNHWNNDCRYQRYCLGLVTFPVEKGNHIIEVRLNDTPIRKIGNIVSFLSLCAIIFMVLRKDYE